MESNGLIGNRQILNYIFGLYRQLPKAPQSVFMSVGVEPLLFRIIWTACKIEKAPEQFLQQKRAAARAFRQITLNSTAQLSVRVQSPLLNQFGQGGFGQRPQFDCLDNQILNTRYAGWRNHARSRQAVTRFGPNQ